MQEPYFSKLDFLGHNTDFHPAMTDVGVCDVFNGDAIKSTFKPSTRTDTLSRLLDPRERGSVKPKTINGSGTTFELKFLLNVADR